MGYLAAVLFLFFYFIRPHDWIPGWEGMNVVKPIMIVGFLGLLVRPGGLAPQGWRTFIRTPADWIMFAYAVYILWTAPVFSDAFSELFPLISFYVVTTQALDDENRLRGYLGWWLVFVLGIVFLALGSVVGIDFTGAKEVTLQNQGRLCLNTWMLSNPNALGHTVIVALPLLYFAMFWRQGITKRALALVFALGALYCVYLTESKGAYVAGFVALVGGFLFGRSKIFQILALVLVLVGGGTLLSMLPRMTDFSGMRSDEGVQGRVMAWDMARASFRTHNTGEGFRQFYAYITWEGEMIKKPPHSSYIQVAADLGYPGLFMFVGLLATGLLTLLRMPAVTPAMETSRRMLFAILLAYIVSSWMIQRPYHAEFFVMMAAISSYHRLENLRRAATAEEPIRAVSTSNLPVLSRKFLRPLLTRPGLIDAALALLLYQWVVFTWDWVLSNF